MQNNETRQPIYIWDAEIEALIALIVRKVNGGNELAEKLNRIIFNVKEDKSSNETSIQTTIRTVKSHWDTYYDNNC